MVRPQPRPILVAIVIALGLTTVSCGFLSGSDDDTAQTTTTSTTEPNETAGAGNMTSTTGTTTTETTAPSLPDLDDVAWVVNDFDGLVDDQGRTIAPSADTGDVGRPTVVRATDGSIYYVIDGRLWRREVDAAEPEEIETEADEVAGVSHDGDGNIIVNRHDDREIVATNGVVTQPNGLVGESDNFITATNGITLRVLPADADIDERGYVTEFRSPAQLQVERAGSTEWTIDAGGIRAPWLNLVDFDGRFAMLVRSPTEPADPMMQHIVYDLDCPTNSATGEGCTRTFWARWGTTSLVGPDRESGDDDLNTVLLDLCPTMGTSIEPPAEMTDPASFDDDFTDDDLDAFRLAALQLTTCDPLGLGDPDQPGLRYVSGSDEPSDDGWMWTSLARSMKGPFTEGDQSALIWIDQPNAPMAVLVRDFGDSRIELQPGRRSAAPVAITITPEAMAVTGRTDEDTADAILAAAEAASEERSIRLGNQLDTTGQAHPDELVEQFIAAIETTPNADVVGEILLTADDVVTSLGRPTEPTAGERALGFLIADFASGGEGIYDELPLADDILLALGSEVVARRQPTELFRRSAWTVNSSEFGGRVGPFNVLDFVPSPSEIAVGPHPRCAGPEALASPPELAAFTRVGILPLEGSIDSCLDWSAVDLFIDDDGTIHGLALHLEAP